MSVLAVVTGLFKPAAKLIDSLHTSDEERLEAKRLLTTLENEMSSKLLGYEQQLLTLQAQTIMSEATGDSWLQRSWRPITMLTFLVLVVADSFGWLPFRLANEAWALLKIGLGGYVIGRSTEKIAPAVLQAFKKGGT